LVGYVIILISESALPLTVLLIMISAIHSRKIYAVKFQVSYSRSPLNGFA
jgi:hypothetical protein